MSRSCCKRNPLLAAILCLATTAGDASAEERLEWQRSRLPFPDKVSGRGVTIAHLADFIGFHPNISSNERRRVWLVDPTADEWKDEDFERAGGNDVMHDLSIASLMAGDGPFAGVAPGANLLVVKGYQLKSRGEKDETPATNDSRGLAALIRWVADRKDEYGARVLTWSLISYDTFVDRMDPWEANVICRAIEYAESKGILVVRGIGNKRFYSAASDQRSPSVLSVGGVTGGWGGAGWTAFTHTLGVTHDGRSLPHLLAPADTPSPLPVARASEVARATVRPAGSPLVGFRGEYAFDTGTSYSGPYVAAVAALCLEVNPRLTPADLRRLLAGTADPIPGARESEQGAGVVNPRRAVELASMATASTPRRASADAAIGDDRIVAALLDDDPRVRSAGLVALFSPGLRDLAFAESLLPVLHATPTESACGALAHLRGWPQLRAKVMASGLDRHPSLAVRYNWGRIALAEDDRPARDAAVEFLRSGQVDLMQLAAARAPFLKSAGLSRPLVEAMIAHPNNLQMQSLGRKALERLNGKTFIVPAEPMKGASESQRNEAILKQWQAWLRETNPM